MRLHFAAAATILLACQFGLPTLAQAEGVLVVGITKDPGKDGFVYGWRVDAKSADDAREQAIKDCRTAKIDNTDNAKKNCKVFEAFRNKCFAFAFDPKIGTPGVGWSVASSKDAAERQALEKCKDLSSSERSKFCAVDKSACDGDAQ